MTFPLEFDLLMIGVCTFIQKKKTKKNTKRKKKQKKKNQNEKKNKKKTRKEKKIAKICLCLISYSIDFFVIGFIIGGLSEIFMRDELRESSLRSFVPWIMTNMYLIREWSNLLLGFSNHLFALPFYHW